MKDELKAIVETRIAWFLAGLYLSGNNVPELLKTLTAFAGF